jgi:hypothetical protein
MAAYSVSATNVTVNTAPQALVFVNPAASPSADLSFIRFWAGQSSTATSAQLNIKIASKVTAFPTLTSTTPTKMNVTGVASVITGGTAGAAGTAGTNSSVLGAGAETLISGEAFNNLNGYLWVATPKELIKANAGSASGVGLFLLTAPSALGNWNMGCIYEEL